MFVEFSVRQTFKGLSGTRTRVATASGTDCDFEFEIGQEYIVYAYHMPNQRYLTTGICTRTQLRAKAHEDMVYLDEVGKSVYRTRIMGIDRRDITSSPLAASEITVVGNGEVYRAMAGKLGEFDIEVKQPGVYKISLIGQAGLEFINHYSSWRVYSERGRPVVEFDRRIEKGDCAFIDFSDFITVRKVQK